MVWIRDARFGLRLLRKNPGFTAVAAASAVSVIVIDWTTTGAPPPTCTLPTFTPIVLWSFTGISAGS